PALLRLALALHAGRAELLADPGDGVRRHTARRRQILVARQDHFLAHDRDCVRRLDADADPGMGDLQNLDLDIRADEEAFSGPPSHYEHGAASGCASSGCRSEYREPPWTACSALRLRRFKTIGEARLAVGSHRSATVTRARQATSRPI